MGKKAELIRIKQFKRSMAGFEGKEGSFNPILIVVGLLSLVIFLTGDDQDNLFSPIGYLLLSILCFYPSFKRRAVQMLVWALEDYYEKYLKDEGIEFDKYDEQCFSQVGADRENRMRHDPEVSACWDGDIPLFCLDDRRNIWIGGRQIHDVDTSKSYQPVFPLTNFLWRKINLVEAVRLALFPGGEAYGRYVVKKRHIRMAQVNI